MAAHGPRTDVTDRAPLRRAAFVRSLRPGTADLYREAHSKVFPSLIHALKAAGIRNYSLFLHQDRVVGYLEAVDLHESWKLLGEMEAARQWEVRMRPLFSEDDTGRRLLEEVFHLD